jgi:putative DNA primase/helicase
VSSAKAAAADYHRGGWCPIPIKKASKQTALARLAPYLERQATTAELRAWSWSGVGIVTGRVSGVLVLDVDGPEGEAELQKHGHPATPMVRTASGGLHLYFRHPKHEVRTGIRVAPGLDVKASGGYVVAPPSVGANGRPYEWIVSTEEAELADPPEWLMRLLGPRQRKGAASAVGEQIPQGQRNQALTSIGGSLRRRGLGEAEILAALEVANERRCLPPLDSPEVEKIAASVARYEPVGNVVPISVNGHGSAARLRQAYLCTDTGNAERLRDRHGADLRYCHPWNRWLVYDGASYRVDDRGAVVALAKAAARSVFEEAKEAPDDDTAKRLGKWARDSLSEGKLRAMISLAQSEPGIPVLPEEMDASADLLNVRNGTIDLRTGELREHRREDLITKVAPVVYDPDAAAPTWAATLERVLPSEEVRAFFKRLCGYAITGDVSEHVLPVLYGTGANGKSTVLNALLEAVGEYGMQAAPDLLIAKSGGHPTEVADLFGMRLVASIEVEDGRRLAESLVKQLTGGDKVRARRMRQDFWQFDPTHTAFLCTNHKPEIRGTDNAIWRRIRLIPFTETIPSAEQDKKLPEKLRTELPGILAWCVEGCLEWQRDGLQAPDEVRKATGAYRSEMDIIGAFLRDECEVNRDHRASFKEVYDRYEEWCEEGGEKPETRRKFNARLKERGRFADRRSGPGGSNEWHGLRLLKKENHGFAGKLKDHSKNDHKQQDSSSCSDNAGNNFSSSVASVEAKRGHDRRVRELVRKGFSEDSARKEVLAASHPVGCECEVCL